MRIVQSLYWLRDELKSIDTTSQSSIRAKLTSILSDPNAALVKDDLVSGLNTLPAWMQSWIRELLTNVELSTKRVLH
jgi:hypothetical protein